MSRSDSLREEEVLLRASLAASRRPFPATNLPASKSENHLPTGCSTLPSQSLKEMCGLLDSSTICDKPSSGSNSVQSVVDVLLNDKTSSLVKSATVGDYNLLNLHAAGLSDSRLDDKCPFDSIPWHVLRKIFNSLELRERCTASRVCREWNSTLTDGKSPMEDVAVLNIFEKTVWEGSLGNNTGSR